MVGMAAVFGSVAILTGRGVRWWSAAGFRGDSWEGRVIYMGMYQSVYVSYLFRIGCYLRSVDLRASRPGRVDGIVAECTTSVRPNCYNKLSHALGRRAVAGYVDTNAQGYTRMSDNSIEARFDDGVLECRRLKDADCCADFKLGSRAAQATSLSQEPAGLARDLQPRCCLSITYLTNQCFLHVFSSCRPRLLIRHVRLTYVALFATPVGLTNDFTNIDPRTCFHLGAHQAMFA